MNYPSLFGKGSAIKKICKIRGIKTNEVLYIGDEVRDIISTKKIGSKIMSVSWGYNAKERLIKEKPDWIADKPSDILKIIKKEF